MEIDDDYEELEALAAKQQQQHHHHHHHHQQQQSQMIITKDPKDMTEQELRCQRLLDAEREMARRKENSRLELEARRKMRGEKRHHSPGGRDPSVVELSDESDHCGHSDGGSSRKSNHSRLSDEMRNPERERSDKSSSSSSDSSTDDDDSSNKDSDSGDNSDYNNPSPLSVDQLAKSDRSDIGSPGHIESNGASKTVENNEKKELEIQMELPPYFPAIQGMFKIF